MADACKSGIIGMLYGFNYIPEQGICARCGKSGDITIRFTVSDIAVSELKLCDDCNATWEQIATA